VTLHTSTVPAPRRSRRGLTGALAGTLIAAGAATVVIAGNQPGRQIDTIGEPSRPAVTRYFDIEANKAASMRALGRHIAEQRAGRTSRYDDIEANKARSQAAR
jgi:NAD(P)-dependent dehydrogenase (short-subunit alcohol dehydrogenase family)